MAGRSVTRKELYGATLEVKNPRLQQGDQLFFDAFEDPDLVSDTDDEEGDLILTTPEDSGSGGEPAAMPPAA